MPPIAAIATDGVAWPASVCLSVGHVRESYKNDSTDQDAVWEGADSDGPKEPCIMSQKSRFPMRKGQSLGVIRHIEKVVYTAKTITVSATAAADCSAPDWPVTLTFSCEKFSPAMRPLVKILWPLVIVVASGRLIAK